MIHNARPQNKATPYRLLDRNGVRGHYAERPSRIIAWLLANNVWFRLYKGDELIDSN